MSVLKNMITTARQLSAACDVLSFGKPVTHVYNPLDYAWKAHEQYLRSEPASVRRDVVNQNLHRTLPAPEGVREKLVVVHLWNSTN